MARASFSREGCTESGRQRIHFCSGAERKQDWLVAWSNTGAHTAASERETSRRNMSPVAMPRTPRPGLRIAIMRVKGMRSSGAVGSAVAREPQGQRDDRSAKRLSHATVSNVAVRCGQRRHRPDSNDGVAGRSLDSNGQYPPPAPCLSLGPACAQCDEALHETLGLVVSAPHDFSGQNA